MKYKYFFLLIFFATASFAGEISESNIKNETLETSFPYARLGVFTFGAEGALGYRFRSERFGWGPNINIAASYTALPSILLNFEMLYYPKSWSNGYWGLMPGIGIAHVEWIKSNRTTIFDMNGNNIFDSSSHDSGRDWSLWGGLELIFGKEFYKNDKRHFHQLSIGFLYVGYNYGWAF